MVSCSTQDSNLIPREVLFGNPEKISPRISPDGKMMAYIAPMNNVLNLWIKTIGKDDDRAVTQDTNRGIRRYFWVHDNKHIMYLQDVGGNENWRLYSVNLETTETTDLTPFDDVQVRIVDVNKNFPNELLIAMNKDNIQVHDVYHLDLSNGELKKIAENPGDVLGWVTDSNFHVRGALFMNTDGGFDLKLRRSPKSSWKTLTSWDYENTFNSGPLGFSKDGKYIYLIDSRDYNTSRLVKMNIKTKKIEVIAEDKQYDVSNVIIHPDTYEIQMVAFNREREEWKILDESIKEDIDIISEVHPGDYFIYNRDNDDKTWLVGFTADDGPVPYYAYDRETKKASLLFYHKPELNNYSLSQMEPISFNSRDGLTIYGYITFPSGEVRTNLPMVLNVHGGPYYRDAWGYNSEAQWFADRGYICLQVNFRGSTGYGKNFLNAANREWGGKMHDDLIDAVNWAISQGYADPEKVAIYGGSYGGYAALVGATFTPDVFCCAVDIVGPSNLITFLNTIPPYWSAMKTNLFKRVGNPETDEEFLKSRSPLFKVDNIKSPMLIAQGANDPRVNQAESEQIVEAMKKKGIEYEYMLFEDEGHGFAKPENRLKFYAAAEKFLAKYLGGRYEEAPPEN
ncbi:MAG: S9 family peptidase [candidate division Zixibacteria bacterium]|nr:S9 family peptidase [candidate division Zixibacteria bacterium]